MWSHTSSNNHKDEEKVSSPFPEIIKFLTWNEYQKIFLREEWGKERPAHSADNLIAIYGPIV